ncbi:MmcQ/YjbR family DNA-binding protein [Vagococcus salmoninarum]|uniref:MmcQ/YjbR family DNA-binding protein n=1 Tax=Vagococcus salmoninarum TaxID=2739 RepID=UPI00187FBB26|nr:MmcQ/YjbR family DNA-binding protein [Vagococcus salmoninarum]MBE9389579.1 MmcQ/YjbR family DNA-binding protein [Vagococcus salmoninarum]
MEELISEIKAYGGTLPGATVTFREEWGSEYFNLGGKFFCLLGNNKEGQLIMTVKGLPEVNEQLREQYSFIVPGYYTNKTHWNSILLTESNLSLTELTGLLKESYQLVLAKLPKKVRDELI